MNSFLVFNINSKLYLHYNVFGHSTTNSSQIVVHRQSATNSQFAASKYDK